MGARAAGIELSEAFKVYRQALIDSPVKVGHHATITDGNWYILHTILAMGARLAGIELSEAFEVYAKRGPADPTYNSATAGDIYILHAILAMGARAAGVELSEAFIAYEQSLKEELPGAGRAGLYDPVYHSVTDGDTLVIRAILAMGALNLKQRESDAATGAEDDTDGAGDEAMLEAIHFARKGQTMTDIANRYRLGPPSFYITTAVDLLNRVNGFEADRPLTEDEPVLIPRVEVLEEVDKKVEILRHYTESLDISRSLITSGEIIVAVSAVSKASKAFVDTLLST